MRASYRALVCGLWVPALIACGNGSNNDGFDAASSSPGDDAADSSSSGSSSGSSGSSGSSSGGFGGYDGSYDAPVNIVPSDCKAGHYDGAFTGSYSSSIALGIPLTVTGNVSMTLNQAGDGTKQCVVQGQGEFISEKCSDVFQVSGGSVTGVANQLAIGEAGIGGYPYYCSLSGTLDCAKKRLVNGWIQCTYCILGPLGDGGTCALGGGGYFAGPVTAGYDTGNHSFINGTWNGAEALAGNDGGSPLPDGGSINDVLALDGGYGFLGKYGGSGGWNAVLH